MNFSFPQYRKLSNERSYYKIENASTLLEIQRTGQRWTEYTLNVRILPERNLIMDLLEINGDQYVIIDENDFETFRKECESNLKRF